MMLGRQLSDIELRKVDLGRDSEAADAFDVAKKLGYEE